MNALMRPNPVRAGLQVLSMALSKVRMLRAQPETAHTNIAPGSEDV
jgi:hypothetical protein